MQRQYFTQWHLISIVLVIYPDST